MTEAWEAADKYAYPMEDITKFTSFPSEPFRYHLQYGSGRGRIHLLSKATKFHWCVQMDRAPRPLEALKY